MLLGQLADELSQLVRSDVELAAAERMPEVRQTLGELAMAAAGLVALLFALAAASWGAALGLTHVIPGWSAALVVAGAWLIVAVVLFAREHPRKLLDRLSAEQHTKVMASNKVQRDQAEREIRETAELLAQALLREAEAQGLRAASSLAGRGVEEVEDETRHVLTELANALLAPGKAGLSMLDRLTGAGGETT